MGVWIETTVLGDIAPLEWSLLMWECGLKHYLSREAYGALSVTPYVGVWIET